LLKDKVAEVRLGAIRLLSTLARYFFCDTSGTDSALLHEMTQELVAEVNTFVTSDKWKSRQVFVLLCEQLLLDCALPSNVFIEHFFLPLLALSTDNVPNVRLALSRCLSKTFNTCEPLQSEMIQVLGSLNVLRNDSDADTSAFAESILANCEHLRMSTTSDMDIELNVSDDDSKMNCEDTCN